MKKIIVLVALILLSVVSIAQIKFGVRGGMTLSSYNSAQVFYKFKPGVHIGGVADIPLGSSKFSFVPGVYFADKGAKIDHSQYPTNSSHYLDYYFTENRYSYQLQVPLLFTYNIPINDKIKLKPQIGVYLSYRILGIYNEERDYVGTVSSDYPTELTSYHYFYEKNGSMWGHGGNIGLSIFYNKFSYTFSCDVGDSNDVLSPEYPDICMFFSLGYNF